MALKHLNNNLPLSPPAISSPEEAVASKFQSSLYIARPRATKRARESSDDESSDEDRENWRINRTSMMRPRGLQSTSKPRRRKRTCIEGPEQISLDEPIRGSGAEEEFDGEQNEGPSTVPLNGVLNQSILPTISYPMSEYANVNGFLRQLHLSRSAHSFMARRLSASSLPGIRAADRSHSLKDHERYAETKELEVGKQEHDSVSKIYEEANRALGRLMLSRHPRDKGRNVMSASDGETDNGYESSEDSS